MTLTKMDGWTYLFPFLVGYLYIINIPFVPQMWACALGHQGAAVLLYRWNSLALGIPDSLGRLPLAVARSRGHTRLARCLEELHSQVRETTDPAQDPGSNLSHASSPAQLRQPAPPLSPLSTSPDTGE